MKYNNALIHEYNTIRKAINFNMEKGENKLRLFITSILVSIISTDTGKMLGDELTHTTSKNL